MPGSDGLDQADDEAVKFARTAGYPVLIKAAAGGGGRGMRVARNEAALLPGLHQAQGRGRGRLQGRQRLPREVHRAAAPHRGADPRRPPRQRRPPLGARLLAAAPAPEARRGIARPEPAGRGPRRRSARPPSGWPRQAGYYNAGTCEFLVDQNNNFYFIEVNARIQVEHPVTELVTGIDLVREQIRIAAGEKLRFTQKDIVHARLRHRVPHQRRGPGQRLPPQPRHGHDAGSRRAGRACGSTRTSSPGYRVPPNYDSMVAKLLVHQPTRAEALAVMRRALREFVVEGIKTTIPILREIFDTPEFIDGKVDTTFIERSLMPARKG